MKVSDMIEAYIRQMVEENTIAELRRSELATMFHCVPSQINYVIATRFIPELGFYVESRRGGGGYIKISRTSETAPEFLSDVLEKIGRSMSQSVIDIYLQEFIRYNVLDEKTAILIRALVSDKSLAKVDLNIRDEVRADMFKNSMIHLMS